MSLTVVMLYWYKRTVTIQGLDPDCRGIKAITIIKDPISGQSSA